VSAQEAAARRALSRNPELWYHSIELAPGVVTPGSIDLRKAAEQVLPARLDGARALDVATFDGFWAFELERRGAEVVAVDLERIEQAEFPPRNREALEREAHEQGFELGFGFRVAAEALGSQVTRVPCNVYELTAEAVGGPVDFAFCGALLLHLRDPVRALERIAGTLRPGGELRLLEPFSVSLTLRWPRRPVARFRPLETRFSWWLSNLAALKALLVAAGYEDVRRLAFARPPGAHRDAYVGLSARRGA
jgi:SAM-dependent methyltransferase